MKAVKGIYENGSITFEEGSVDPGPIEVVVVFPETVDDPWQVILDEDPLRPSFLKFAQACEEEIRQGKSQPLDMDQL
jgi:hypothetical protein